VSFQSYKDKVAQAKSILIVGGNAVGVELAGELVFSKKLEKK
jgi:NADH dehydrogenase FAD-containing subunit